MKSIRLPGILTDGEDGYIVASVPVIPGCISHGRTVKEALENVRGRPTRLERREEEGWKLPENIGVGQVKVAA